MNKLLLWIAPFALVACGGGQPTRSTTGAQPPTGKVPEAAHVSVAPPVEPQATGTPRNDLIPRGVLFGNPERANVQLSPDGKQIAWLAPKDGVMNLWVAPIDKLDAAKVVTSDTKRPIRNYEWAFTNKHLLYEQDNAGDENFHVFRVDLADGKVTDLTPYPGARAGLAATSEKKPNTIAITINDRDPKLMDAYTVDLTTGARTPVVINKDNLASYVFDTQLGVPFASRMEKDGSVSLLARDKDAWVVRETVPFEDADTTQIVGISLDGKTLYVSDSRGRDTGGLFTVDVKSKKAKLLAEDKRADVGAVIFHPTKHTPQAVAFNYERNSYQVLDPSVKADFAALAKIDPGADFAINSRTLDDKSWLVVTTSPQHPRRYHVWNRATKKATFLFAAQPALDPQPLVAMHPVVIKARDGLSLVSYLTLPASADPDGDGKANTPTPLVLLVHGGPWARDAWGYSPLPQLFANRGYATLSVNYRGSTGFGKKYLNAGNLQWSKAMHEDLLDAVTWAIDQKVAPKDKICIAGGSYGGYATLVGLAMTPDVFACGVDIVGPSNLLTLLASIPPYWAPALAMFHERMGDPTTPEGKALLTAASPLTHAKDIKRPLLIGQGANDPRVKQAEAEQIVADMKAHGLPVSYALFPDEGHGFARPENNIAFFGITEAFLSAHLGGVYQPFEGTELKSSSMQIKAGQRGIPGL